MNRTLCTLFHSWKCPLLAALVLVGQGATQGHAQHNRLVRTLAAPAVKKAGPVLNINRVALNPQPLPPGIGWPPRIVTTPGKLPPRLPGYPPAAVPSGLQLQRVLPR